MAGKCKTKEQIYKEKLKCVLRKRTKKKLIKAFNKRGVASTLSQLKSFKSLNKSENNK